MFSPPVSREVTSADVKYAIERAFTANVANGYARRLLRRPQGRARSRAGRLQGDQGHRDARRLRRSSSTSPRARARRWPARWPCRSRSRCRRSTREKYDKETPSTYGEGHAVYTGPYMVESDAEGKATGYVPGKQHPHRPQPRLRGRSTTSAPRSSTRSRSRPATTTRAVATRRILSRREHGLGRPRAAREPAQAAARVQQDRALGGPRRRLAHDLDGHEPPAVRRHRRPQGRHRRLRPRRGAPAAWRRGARPDRPAPDPAGHGRVRGVQRRRRLGRRDGLAGQKPEGDRARPPSTSRRRASPRASTRAARRS